MKNFRTVILRTILVQMRGEEGRNFNEREARGEKILTFWFDSSEGRGEKIISS